MCGLMGVVTHAKNGFTANNLEAMWVLLWLTQTRGYDSVGVAGMDNQKKATWHKMLGTPNHLFATQNWKDFRQMMLGTGEMMFGHCRAATKGTVNEENAHPFIVEREDGSQIILAHNGTLYDHQSLAGFKDFEVDSHWLAHCVATYGAEETFAKVNGPIATIWIDTRDNSFNVFRNADRPLCYIKDVSGSFYIQSEREWLEAVCRRSKIFASHGGVYATEFKAQTHYQLDWNGADNKWKEVAIARVYPRHTQSSFPHHRGSVPYWFLGDDDDEGDVGVVVRSNPPVSEGTKIWTDYYKWNRDAYSDTELIAHGRIESVVFTEGGSRITRIDNQRTVNEKCAPYFEGLCSIFSDDGGKTVYQMRKQSDGSFSKIRVRPYNDMEIIKNIPPSEAKPALFLPPPTVIQEPAKSSSGRLLEIPCYYLKQKKGKACHWKMKVPGGDSVRHKGVCSYDNVRLFTEYENSKDSKIVVGQRVIIEINTIEERTHGLNKVIGYGLTPNKEQHIEYAFYDRRTKEELTAIHFFEGIINVIRLCSAERWKSTGNVVEALLKEVKPVNTDPNPVDTVEVNSNVFH